MVLLPELWEPHGTPFERELNDEELKSLVLQYDNWDKNEPRVTVSIQDHRGPLMASADDIPIVGGRDRKQLIQNLVDKMRLAFRGYIEAAGPGGAASTVARTSVAEDYKAAHTSTWGWTVDGSDRVLALLQHAKKTGVTSADTLEELEHWAQSAVQILRRLEIGMRVPHLSTAWAVTADAIRTELIDHETPSPKARHLEAMVVALMGELQRLPVPVEVRRWGGAVTLVWPKAGLVLLLQDTPQVVLPSLRAVLTVHGDPQSSSVLPIIYARNQLQAAMQIREILQPVLGEP